MVQKPITISVSAAVTVSAILMLIILATISSTNQAFAYVLKPTALTINVSPTTVKSGSTAPISVTGKLTSEGSGVGGATITFAGMRGEEAVTDADGTFSTSISTAHLSGTNSITAYFDGDKKGEYEPSDSNTIKLTVTH